MALIDIGSQKQLFADDYLIESLSSTRQVVNPAEKVEHNPVVRQDRPWEGNHVGAKTIFFDAEEQRFKMWYTTYWYRVRREGDDIVVDERFDEYAAQRLCLATSNDGVHWEKPELGLVEFDGSKRNNILPETCLAPRDFGSAYRDSHLIYDLHDSAERRYKLVMTVYDDENPGMKLYLFYSPDGFDWTPHAEAPVVDYAPRRGRWGPMYFMGWDPIRRCYAVHMENNQHFRGPLGKRVVGRAESADFRRVERGRDHTGARRRRRARHAILLHALHCLRGSLCRSAVEFSRHQSDAPPPARLQPRRHPLRAQIPRPVYRARVPG